MEVLAVFLLLVALAFAAQRWGYDSRWDFLSKEEELASRGLRWPEREQRVAPGPVQPSPNGTVERRSPEVAINR